jgi:hypothetical protein
VRLQGLAAPERRQAGGLAAAEKMRELTTGRTVVCDLTNERTWGRRSEPAASAGVTWRPSWWRRAWARDCPRYGGGRYAELETPAGSGCRCRATACPVPAEDPDAACPTARPPHQPAPPPPRLPEQPRQRLAQARVAGASERLAGGGVRVLPVVRDRAVAKDGWTRAPARRDARSRTTGRGGRRSGRRDHTSRRPATGGRAATAPAANSPPSNRASIPSVCRPSVSAGTRRPGAPSARTRPPARRGPCPRRCRAPPAAPP